MEFAGGKIILGPSYGMGSCRTHAGDASRLRGPMPADIHRAKGKAAALPLIIDAAHAFISALIFQVENLVKTKN